MDENETDIRTEMERRILSGEPFTFTALYAGYSSPKAYRIADRLIQKHRRAGNIAFKRNGHSPIWSTIPKP